MVDKIFNHTIKFQECVALVKDTELGHAVT